MSVEIRRRDGSTCWLSESVRVVRNPDGSIDHFEGVATDITQRREAARARDRSPGVGTLFESRSASPGTGRAMSDFVASLFDCEADIHTSNSGSPLLPVNGALVFTINGATNYTEIAIDLDAGVHTLTLHYYEMRGQARVSFDYYLHADG